MKTITKKDFDKVRNIEDFARLFDLSIVYFKDFYVLGEYIKVTDKDFEIINENLFLPVVDFSISQRLQELIDLRYEAQKLYVYANKNGFASFKDYVLIQKEELLEDEFYKTFLDEKTVLKARMYVINYSTKEILKVDTLQDFEQIYASI